MAGRDKGRGVETTGCDGAVVVVVVVAMVDVVVVR